MDKITDLIIDNWQEIAACLTIISFFFSIVFNIINRKIKNHLYFVLREVEITSHTLMEKIEKEEITLDHCYEAFHANRSLSAAGMRMIISTPFTREEYERGALYRFLLRYFRILRDIKSEIIKAFAKKDKSQ